MRKTKLSPKKKRILIIVAVVALLLAIGFALTLTGNKTPPPPPEPVYSQLTGEEVEPEVAERPILGVMIENSEEARPQTGLDSAGIVFEATTEGGITRYLAFYQENMPEIVGPIRSLRPHFLDWAMGFVVSIAHVGGSPEALETAKKRDAKSLNEFEHSGPYYRDDSREPPHNMYARAEDLRKLQEELGHEKSQFDTIPRSDDSPSQNPQAPSITVDYSAPLYLAEFRYDTASNSYTRYLTKKPHIDSATNKPITVKNLIVIKMIGQKATGSGQALVFKNGDVIKATWEKPSYKQRIKIIDEQDNEIPLNRGDTWFAAVPSDRPITY